MPPGFLIGGGPGDEILIVGSHWSRGCECVFCGLFPWGGRKPRAFHSHIDLDCSTTGIAFPAAIVDTRCDLNRHSYAYP